MRPKINNREMSDSNYIYYLELINELKTEELNKYKLENLKLRFLLATGVKIDLKTLK